MCQVRCLAHRRHSGNSRCYLGAVLYKPLRKGEAWRHLSEHGLPLSHASEYLRVPVLMWKAKRQGACNAHIHSTDVY